MLRFSAHSGKPRPKPAAIARRVRAISSVNMPPRVPRYRCTPVDPSRCLHCQHAPKHMPLRKPQLVSAPAWAACRRRFSVSAMISGVVPQPASERATADHFWISHGDQPLGKVISPGALTAALRAGGLQSRHVAIDHRGSGRRIPPLERIEREGIEPPSGLVASGRLFCGSRYPQSWGHLHPRPWRWLPDVHGVSVEWSTQKERSLSRPALPYRAFLAPRITGARWGTAGRNCPRFVNSCADGTSYSPTGGRSRRGVRVVLGQGAVYCGRSEIGVQSAFGSLDAGAVDRAPATKIFASRRLAAFEQRAKICISCARRSGGFGNRNKPGHVKGSPRKRFCRCLGFCRAKSRRALDAPGQGSARLAVHAAVRRNAGASLLLRG